MLQYLDTISYPYIEKQFDVAIFVDFLGGYNLSSLCCSFDKVYTSGVNLKITCRVCFKGWGCADIFFKLLV